MRMNPLFVVGLVSVLVHAACATPRFAVDAGYTQMKVAGTVALANSIGSLNGAVEQGIDSAFGLGDQRGSPFLRVDAAFGGPELFASGFSFAEHGRGVLAANFGGIASATPVNSEFELLATKIGAAWSFDLGPASIAPGLAFDVFDFDFRASDSVGNAEIIDELVAVPVLMLRAEGGLGPVRLRGEVGYIEGRGSEGSTNRFLDAEAAVSWSPAASWHVLAGYRHIGVDATGETDTQTFAIDIDLRGWFVGGGIAF